MANFTHEDRLALLRLIDNELPVGMHDFEAEAVRRLLKAYDTDSKALGLAGREYEYLEKELEMQQQESKVYISSADRSNAEAARLRAEVDKLKGELELALKFKELNQEENVKLKIQVADLQHRDLGLQIKELMGQKDKIDEMSALLISERRITASLRKEIGAHRASHQETSADLDHFLEAIRKIVTEWQYDESHKDTGDRYMVQVQKILDENTCTL